MRYSLIYNSYTHIFLEHEIDINKLSLYEDLYKI